MKKNLRSVTRNSEGVYEYFRLDAEEAMQLVDAGTHIFISKEEYKRQSKFYQEIPCNGTLIKHIDKEGNKSYNPLYNINYAKNLGEKYPSSTKIATCSSEVSTIRRRNKYAKKNSNNISKFYANYKANQEKRTYEDLLNKK